MIIIEDNFNIKLKHETYIALGSFDGLHMGHMGLINKTLELSRLNNIKSMIYTFKNHPLSIINENKSPKLLMDRKTKLDLLEGMGIDIVNLVNFDKEYMEIQAEQFIINLIEYYNLKGLIVGFNYRFGYKNIGDVELLKKYSDKFGFELHVIDSVSYRNEVVSSTKIRGLISEGKVKAANEMLLIPFMLSGEVIKGRQLGRTLGFPTANLKYNENFILPKNGVYYTVVEYKNNFYKAMTSVGINPTVQISAGKIFIETYILDFNKSIYGEEIKVYFIDRMREEIKFQSLHELKDQLQKDKFFIEKQNLQKSTFKL